MDAGAEGDEAPMAEAEGDAFTVVAETGGNRHDDEAEREELLIARAQKLMDKITASSDNPDPRLLHALASIVEREEARYMEKTGYSDTHNGRASQTIGRLGDLLRDNEEFFELISSRFLSQTGYPISVQAASARLLVSCLLNWMYPHVFEEPVLAKIKGWVMDDNDRVSGETSNVKHDIDKKMPSDSEMLKTYSVGLMAMCLAGGGHVVEEALTCGLSTKLMRYLRTQVLGFPSSSQKDSATPFENKSSATSIKNREEGRFRSHLILDQSQLGDLCIAGEETSGARNTGIDHERSYGQIDTYWNDDEELPNDEGTHASEGVLSGESKSHGQILGVNKMKSVYFDESGRDDPLKRRTPCSRGRYKGKGRSCEGSNDNEVTLTSPVSGSRLGLGRNKDRVALQSTDPSKKLPAPGRSAFDVCVIERADADECFQGCKIGSQDISDSVKKAVSAAEAEARAANAPEEAIKAAGDAAAELVKSAAIEELRKTNDDTTAVLAAAEAAQSVIDAAKTVKMSRKLVAPNVGEGLNIEATKPNKPDIGEEVEELSIPDRDSLARVREKHSIQCLEMLGKYVEVLGPVFREKGVDVCIALLQRCSTHESLNLMLMPDLLKLICTLATHRKFAAMFVDVERGGIQKLLAVPRVDVTFFGLSSCLFTVGSLQRTMERVCALPSEIIHQVVDLGLQLLECSNDQARINAASFFNDAFVFRAVLDCFDAQNGVQKLLNLLHDPTPSEVLTLSKKQIAFHTYVALRQYYRAHLLLLVDSIRPKKGNQNTSRLTLMLRAPNKPLDISDEVIDTTVLNLLKDRKLGPAFVRAPWPAVDKFLALNGHIVMLELCMEAPQISGYLQDWRQYALGVLHIVTLVPRSRKKIIDATLSNHRDGIAVILDVANSAKHEIAQLALSVLVNLVCPPPSISIKASTVSLGLHDISLETASGLEARGRRSECNLSDQALSSLSDMSEQNGASTQSDQCCSVVVSTPCPGGLVGDRRISLGAKAGCAGLAAQLEQGYFQARKAVRANNGIKILLDILQTRDVTPPVPLSTLDCIRALACRVLLGLARDDAIAHILTKLQVGKKLSELIRDTGNQPAGSEQGRWQTELAQAAVELIAIVTNSGRASTLAATDAATPTLRRIERAAIAAATPISYDNKELLLLMHEHLLASGLSSTAATLLKESQLTPLPSLAAQPSLSNRVSAQETLKLQFQWPCGRIPNGFLSWKRNDISIHGSRSEPKSAISSSFKKKLRIVSPSLSCKSGNLQGLDVSGTLFNSEILNSSRIIPASPVSDSPRMISKSKVDAESQNKIFATSPLKRKLSELKDGNAGSSSKRLTTGDPGLQSSAGCQTSASAHRSSVFPENAGSNSQASISSDSRVNQFVDSSADNQTFDRQLAASQHGLPNESLCNSTERLTLDSIVLQYLEHQHRQCHTPIATLPPLSLFRTHVCPEPRHRLDAPSNVTARFGAREFRGRHGGVNGTYKDRQFVYSRFRPWRNCREDGGGLLSCITFLGDSSQIIVGSDSGELKIFDVNSSNLLENCAAHQTSLTRVQAHLSGDKQLVLSSTGIDIRLWDASSLSSGPIHSFDGCKAGRFSNSGYVFASLSTEPNTREILLYDVQTGNLDAKLSDESASSNKGHGFPLIHFSPLDTMVLWNGVLWDPRVSAHIHQFDRFTDYGGGGFHPARNEVIINSEVWDLRKFQLLYKIPHLDQTVINFNASGDVIYAFLRRNYEDINSAMHPRRVRHPLYSAFRTVDAVNYSEIATIPIDRCVLDLATEPTDSCIGLITMDDQELFSAARIYDVGRRKPTDDDSDPDDDAESDEDEDEEDDMDEEADILLGPELDSEVESDSDGDDNDDEEDDETYLLDGIDMDGENGVVQVVTEGEEDDMEEDGDDSEGDDSFSDEEDGGQWF
uniref:LisH domain-containing protein n=1 Tax=Kalanchoe fedtschenkoi TaxID=63787 RepID=A0A7N0U836_KALFE